MLRTNCILPVLDLKAGRVVHAVAGQRANYQPLKSRWAHQADDPFVLTAALKAQLGLYGFYVADLDALEQQGSQAHIIEELAQCDLLIWLDAGLQTVQQVETWLACGIHRVIIASETLSSSALLKEVAQHVDRSRLVFSLDLKAGKVRSQPGVFTATEPFPIIEEVVSLGYDQLIILDTEAVGVAQGPSTIALCQSVRARFPNLSIISGGGVRHLQDIAALQAAGVNRVLVSTWLHAKSTTTAELSSAGLLP